MRLGAGLFRQSTLHRAAMSTNVEVLTDSDESDYSQDPIEVAVDLSYGEHITQTLKKQYETEESITSLFERHYMLSEMGDYNMCVLNLLH